MLKLSDNLIRIAALTALALGSASARTYQLKKVLIINETGSGGFAHTSQINFTNQYYSAYLGPKYGFECAIPRNSAAIDSVMRDDSLKTYDVVVLNGGSRVGGAGAIQDTGAKHAFERWMKAGGGCVGIHDLLDDNNTWPWMRDSLFNGANFTLWSNWGSDPNTKVQWDTVKTNGALNSLKPEYDSIRACFPRTRFTYPDQWLSFSHNVRPNADVLMTIDESTYHVPQGGEMVDHPVMWAYHMPADTDGNQGRFIYFARGGDVGAFDGTSSNHAPASVAEGAIQQGDTVFSDTSHTLMTKGALWPMLQWAAGLRVHSVSVQVRDGGAPSGAHSHNLNGILKVQVQGPGSHEVRVFNLAGKVIAHRSGHGDANYSFANLRRPSLYLVEVKSARKTTIQRILL